jgi:Holliday junction resolvasome RuvABC endonuclease subunit
MDYKKSLVLGIDIGLNSTGWSTAHIEKGILRPIDCGCINVSSDIPKKYKYKGTQAVMKSYEILKGLEALCSHCSPVAVAIETPGGNTQSAPAARALGACAALIGFVLHQFPGKTVLVKPSDVKKCIRQKGKVEKDEIMQYVWNKYVIPNVPTNKEGSYVKSKFEHIADSVLVLEAALKTSKLFGGI